MIAMSLPFFFPAANVAAADAVATTQNETLSTPELIDQALADGQITPISGCSISPMRSTSMSRCRLSSAAMWAGTEPKS